MVLDWFERVFRGRQMAEFVCKVADAEGRIFTQVEIGGTTAEVRKRLGDKGFYVYSIRGRRLPAWLVGGSESGFQRLSGNDFLLFNQQLATLIRAGLPVLQSLDMLARRSTNAALKKILDAVRDKVRAGAALSEGMEATGVFPPVYTTALLSGERGGDLVGVLGQYVAYQKISGAVRRRLITALIYPALLIIVSAFVLSYVIAFVIPQFAALYDDMNATLPVITQVVVTVALQFRSWILAILLGLAAVVAAVVVFSRSSVGGKVLDGIWMDFPIIGDVLKKFRLAQFSRTLSTLLRGGVPLVTALETAGGAMGSPILRQAVLGATERVREGESLNGALAESGVMPEMITEMVEVGEATGELSAMLNSVAEFYDEELEAQISTLMTLVEPLLLLVVGGAILFILIALYLPIFSIGSAIQ